MRQRRGGVGNRVIAWRGDRKDDHGTVTRMDGIYHCYIRWDSDGEETHYENAAIGWEGGYGKEEARRYTDKARVY